MITKLKTLSAVAAVMLLSLLGAGNVSAAHYPKTLLRTKTTHARPATLGTRLVATGSVNPDTSSIKAISTDNHFTWIYLTPVTIIVQGGRPVTPGSIGEGDKLICQGTWVDDAWGPIYQAKRVEVIGSIGASALQEKVAAACQHIAQDGSGMASGSESDQVDGSDMSKRQGQEYVDYIDAVQSRYAALKDAKKR